MNWEAPTVEDIACGMEVTGYSPATEGDDDRDELNEPLARESAD